MGSGESQNCKDPLISCSQQEHGLQQFINSDEKSMVYMRALKRRLNVDQLFDRRASLGAVMLWCGDAGAASGGSKGIKHLLEIKLRCYW